MTTSLYWSVGTVDAVEWARVLNVTFKMTWVRRATNLHQICVKPEHSSLETIWMIQKAFGDDAMSAVQIKVWYKCFKDGRDCSKWSTLWKSCNKEHTWGCWTCTAVLNKDRQLTMQELEADLGIPKTTVSEILTRDLGMKHVVAKFVWQLLLPQQKEHCAAVGNDLIQTATNEPGFFKNCGSTARIPKWRPNHPSGSHLVLHTWRRCSKISARSRPC